MSVFQRSTLVLDLYERYGFVAPKRPARRVCDDEDLRQIAACEEHKRNTIERYHDYI
jgi:hypothetical protein